MSTAHLVAPNLTGTLWEELVSELGVGVLLLAGRGRVRAATGQTAELLGLSEDELASGARPAGWRVEDDHGSTQPDLAVLAAQVLRADTTATIPLVIGAGGVARRRLWVEMFPIVLRGERLVLTILRPVQTDVWRSKGLLDPLTGLPNRVLLFDRLDQALRRARVRGTSVTVVLADVRGLGDINLAGGFECGDHVLTGIAERLVTGLGADHTVARYAGATFAVVTDHPQGTGERLADRVAALVEARVGWAASDGADTVPDLIGLAQTRLKQAR